MHLHAASRSTQSLGRGLPSTNRLDLTLLKTSVTSINEEERTAQGHLQRPCLQTLEKGVNSGIMARRGGVEGPAVSRAAIETNKLTNEAAS